MHLHPGKDISKSWDWRSHSHWKCYVQMHRIHFLGYQNIPQRFWSLLHDSKWVLLDWDLVTGGCLSPANSVSCSRNRCEMICALCTAAVVHLKMFFYNPARNKLFELMLPSCQLKAACPFSDAIIKAYSSTAAHWMFHCKPWRCLCVLGLKFITAY